jgi:RNA polymerase sigma factor (sigma-70 family)
VTSWPSLAGVDDRQLAESLRLAGANALTKVYDAYAARLYDYCHALLQDQEAAADAVHDSLIAAKRHAGKLQDPERFRGWLYAIARNHCVRLRRDPDRGLERRPAPENDEEEYLDAKQRAQRKEARLVIHSALTVLTVPEREAVDLTGRHELDPREIARMFGMTEPDAGALVEEARRNLTNALSVVITVRAVGKECGEASSLVDSWPVDGETCRKLIKHVRSCKICREQLNRKVPTRALLQALPAAKIGGHVRTRVHTTATAPERSRERLEIARLAEPFDREGWPVPAEPAAELGGPARRSPRLWPAVAAAVCGIAVVGTAVACLPDWDGKPQDAGQAQAAPTAGVPSDVPSGDPSVDPSAPGSPSPNKSSKTPKASPKPSKTTKRPQPPQQPDPTPRLTIRGCSMESGQRSCSIRLTASGGAVRWQVTDTSIGLQASGGGTLAAGQSTNVTVSRQGLCLGGGEGSVSFSPGGAVGVSWIC